MAFCQSNLSFLSTKTFDCCLGNGAFGIVLKAIDQSSKATAVKFIFPSEDAKEQERIGRECKLTKELEGHENVIKILNVVENKFTAVDLKNLFPDTILSTKEQIALKDGYVSQAKRYGPLEVICIEMELCGETLKRWIEQQQQHQEKNVQLKQVTIAKNVIEGLKYLHDNKIIHRDLKPENIMFSKEWYQLPVKIGDFGLCRKIRSEESTLTSRMGTADYMAPEAFGNKYSYQADLFSLGLVIWEVVQLIPPNDRKKMFDRLVNDKEEAVVVEHSIIAGVRELIIGLTKKKNEDRIKSVDYVMEVAKSWDDFYLPGSEFIAKNVDELEFCLENVNKGGTIQLINSEYEGVFLLKQDNVKVRGVEGSVLKLLVGEGMTCLTIVGNGCSVSNVTISTGMQNTGIELLGSKNELRNVKFVGGLYPLYVIGDKNQLQNLNISNAYTGIWIVGYKTTVEVVRIENVKCGIYIENTSNENSLSNISGRNLNHGIEMAGSHNNISHVNLIKNSTESWFVGVLLYSDSVNNRIKNLTCTGFESSNYEWGLCISSGSAECSVENSECGPVWVEGVNATLTNVECGELIEVDSKGVKLIKCRGKKLVASKKVTLTDCNFDSQVLPNLWRRLRNTKLF